MPRWKALPQDLDPQIREFTGQLRRLVDRSGLGLAALADRTGYSRTSWERYLNGRLLAPRGAIVALAEVTGTNHVHLNTMWELAERAWSRAEMRHDMTMEAIRITQARAALGETGQNPRGHGRSRPSGGVGTAREGAADEGRSPSVPAQRGPVPQQPPQQPPSGPYAGPGEGLPPAVAFAAGLGGQQQPPPTRRDAGRGRSGGRRRTAVITAAAAGIALVVTAAVLLTGSGDDSKAAERAATPSPKAVTSAPALPAGVGCGGAGCTGKDPEDMGCGGEHARTISSATVGGAFIEVRYSKTCSAAWARITKGGAGDSVEITAGTAAQNGTVKSAAEAYTPMVAVRKVADVQACATLASGTQGCTAEAAG